jgi:hypothetical protein
VTVVRTSVGLLAALAGGFLVATVAFGHGGAVRVADARAAGDPPPAQAITTPDEAIQWLAGSSSALGATPGSAVQAGALPADADGPLQSAPIFRVDMSDGSTCLVLLTGLTSCGAAPDDAQPVVGIAADVDGPDGSLPFIAVADVAADVTGVTFACAGGTAPTTIEDGLMTLVAPTTLGDPSTCSATATLADGSTWKWSFSR